jgi:hypothetical protein
MKFRRYHPGNFAGHIHSELILERFSQAKTPCIRNCSNSPGRCESRETPLCDEAGGMTAWKATSSVIHRQFYAELDEPHAGKPSRAFGIGRVRLFIV